MSLGVVALAAVAGVASGSTDHVGHIAFGCEARTEEQLEHWPSMNFSLAEYLGRHGTLQVVACIVQGWDQVLSLKSDSNWNTAPFADKCIAIGSSCGTPCGYYAGHSDTCNTTTMTIKPEYLYNENHFQNHTSGQGFSTRHVVSIKSGKSSTGYPMDACETCETMCADSNWMAHCRAGGKTDAGTNCDDWKCKDPPEDDDDNDDDEPEVHCNERYKCRTLMPSGLQIEDLSIQAKFNEDDVPPADKGLLYSVIFAGTNLQRSSGSAQPGGSWQLIYTPRETEALQRDLSSVVV